MAVEEILIKFVSDTAGLEDANAELAKTGKVAEADIKRYNELSKVIRDEVVKELKAAGLEFNKTSKTIADTAKKVDTNFKSLRQQLAEAKNEAARLGEQFGTSSIEFKNAATRAGELQAELKDLNATLDALDPDAKAKAFNQFGQSAFGAFQVATGALQLFGIENERVNQLAQQFQGFLNFTQGISQLGGLGDAFSNIRTVLGFTTAAQTALNTAELQGAAASQVLTAATTEQIVVTEGATVATSALSKVMTALPIIAITVLVAGLVKTFIDLSNAADQAAENAKDFAEKTKEGLRQAKEGAADADLEFRKATGAVTELGAAYEATINKFKRDNGKNYLDLEATQAAIIKTKDEITALEARIQSLQNGRQTDATPAIIAQQQKRLQSVKSILASQEAAENNLTQIINENLEKNRKQFIVTKQDITSKNKEENTKQVKDNKTAAEQTIGDLLKLKDEALAPVRSNLAGNLTEFKLFTEGLYKEVDIVIPKTAATVVETGEEIKLTFEDVFNATLDTYASFADAYASITSSLSQVEIDNANEAFSRNEEGLRRSLDQRLITQQDYDNNVKALENQREARTKKIQQEQAKREKALAIFNAAINTSAAIIKQLAATPLPAGLPLVLLVGAQGAAQIAAIAAQPIPKFAKGAKRVQGGVEGQDSVPALVMPGEMIVDRHKTRKYATALDAIYDERITPQEVNTFAKMTPSQRAALIMSAGQQFNQATTLTTVKGSVLQSLNSYVDRSTNSMGSRSNTVKEVLQVLADSSSQDFHELKKAIGKNKKVRIENVDEIVSGLAAVVQTDNPRRR